MVERKENSIKTFAAELGAKVKMKAVRPTRTPGFVVESPSAAGMARKRSSAAVREACFSVEDPMANRPTVLIYDVPTGVCDKDLLRDILGRNLEDWRTWTLRTYSSGWALKERRRPT